MKILVATATVWLTAALAAAQPLSFVENASIQTHGAPRGIVAADFDQDGHLDFAAASLNQPSHDLAIWYGDGHGNFGRETVITLGQADAGPFAIAAGDINHDAHPDLAIALADNNRIAMFLWSPAGFTRLPDFRLGSLTNPREIALADMNRDGNIDVVFTLYERGSVDVLYGDGTGQQWSGLNETTSIGLGAHGLAVVDVDGDGELEIVVTNALTDEVWLLYNNGSNRPFVGTSMPVGSSPRAVAIADINHDFLPDIVTVNTAGNSLTVWFWNPAYATDEDAPNFINRTDVSVGNSPRDVEAFDANGDGFVDLAVASYGNNTVVVIDGVEIVGGRANRFTASSPINPRTLTSGDFDEDGRTDILIGNQGNGMVRLDVNRANFFGRP